MLDDNTTSLDEENKDLDEQSNDLEERQQIFKTIVHGDAKAFKSSQSQYNDYFSSAVILLIFGVFGTIFVIINIMGILTIFNSLFQYIVGLGLFGGFLIGSVFCFRSSAKYKSQISNEDEQHDIIKEFLKNTITQELLQSFDNEGESKESNYLSRIEGLKEIVLKEYSDLDVDFAESLIEEFYNENY